MRLFPLPVQMLLYCNPFCHLCPYRVYHLWNHHYHHHHHHHHHYHYHHHHHHYHHHHHIRPGN
uniref:Uncharacterized protein n=1 Tax=Glossina morsitans morsitans TaxID=37546 RepID=A0A1B0G9R0_GLOMM